MTAPERAGILILRVWMEPGGVLKSRITTTFNLSAADEKVMTASSPQEIQEIVVAFVEEFASSRR